MTVSRTCQLCCWQQHTVLGEGRSSRRFRRWVWRLVISRLAKTGCQHHKHCCMPAKVILPVKVQDMHMPPDIRNPSSTQPVHWNAALICKVQHTTHE
jgi:hypothetical protein